MATVVTPIANVAQAEKESRKPKMRVKMKTFTARSAIQTIEKSSPMLGLERDVSEEKKLDQAKDHRSAILSDPSKEQGGARKDKELVGLHDQHEPGLCPGRVGEIEMIRDQEHAIEQCRHTEEKYRVILEEPITKAFLLASQIVGRDGLKWSGGCFEGHMNSRLRIGLQGPHRLALDFQASGRFPWTEPRATSAALR